MQTAARKLAAKRSYLVATRRRRLEVRHPAAWIMLPEEGRSYRVGKQAQDAWVAARLWDVSEQLTGVRWPQDAAS
jgi:hypothetical protein